jgi:hypothetical protein
MGKAKGFPGGKAVYWRPHPASRHRHCFRRPAGDKYYTSLCGSFVMEDPWETFGKKRFRPAVEHRCAACDMGESKLFGSDTNLPEDGKKARSL